MATTEETLTRLKREAFSGDLGKASPETLNGYAAALCHPQAFTVFSTHEFPQVSETVRIHLLRAHIETLQKHITSLDKKNTRLQWWVIALAVAALISTITQTIYTAIQTNIAVTANQLSKTRPKDLAPPHAPIPTEKLSAQPAPSQTKGAGAK